MKERESQVSLIYQYVKFYQNVFAISVNQILTQRLKHNTQTHTHVCVCVRASERETNNKIIIIINKFNFCLSGNTKQHRINVM